MYFRISCIFTFGVSHRESQDLQFSTSQFLYVFIYQPTKYILPFSFLYLISNSISFFFTWVFWTMYCFVKRGRKWLIEEYVEMKVKVILRMTPYGYKYISNQPSEFYYYWQREEQEVWSGYLLLSLFFYSETACQYWICSFCFDTISVQWSKPLPRANIKEPRTIRPAWESVKRKTEK